MCDWSGLVAPPITEAVAVVAGQVATPPTQAKVVKVVVASAGIRPHLSRRSRAVMEQQILAVAVAVRPQVRRPFLLVVLAVRELF